MWLFDTCSIINLSYCLPVGGLFEARYRERAGWARAVVTELSNQRLRRPPHPQAGRALAWASRWLGDPLVVDDPAEMATAAAIQREIAAGGQLLEAEHLGEAASIVVLLRSGSGRLVSDDLGARQAARARRVAAASTVQIVGGLLALNPPALTPQVADVYLDTLRPPRPDASESHGR